MNRPSYKKLYYKEKRNKNAWINLFNSTLEAFEKNFNMQITNKKVQSYHSFTYVRIINVSKGKKTICLAIPDETEED